MAAYIAEFMTGQEVIDRIHEATGCDGLDAYHALQDAAADGRLAVSIIGGVPGLTPTPRNDVERYEPHRAPPAYWERARWTADLGVMIDLDLFRVVRADVEMLWPREVAAAAAPLPSGTRTNRGEAAEEAARQKLRNLKERPPNREAAYEVLKAAVAAVGPLSEKAFRRVWHDEAPDEWKRPGRPRKIGPA